MFEPRRPAAEPRQDAVHRFRGRLSLCHDPHAPSGRFRHDDAIYPLLAVGYFISFLYYSNLLFLYYQRSERRRPVGAIFAAVSLGASLLSRALPHGFGTGFTLAGFAAFTFSFFRLRWSGT